MHALCFQNESYEVVSIYNGVDNTKDPIRSNIMQHLLIVGGVHGWVGVGLLGLLLLVPHDHLHRLGPVLDLRLLLLSLVIFHSRGSLSLDVGQVLKRRHLDSN